MFSRDPFGLRGSSLLDVYTGHDSKSPSSPFDRFLAIVVAVAAVLGVTNVGPEWLRPLSTWISFALPIAAVVLVWRTATPSIERWRVRRAAAAVERQRAEAKQRAAVEMTRVLKLVRDVIGDRHRYGSICGEVHQVANSSPPERREAIFARSEPICGLGDTVRQLPEEVSVGDIEVVSKLMRYCIDRVLDMLPGYIAFAADEANLSACERLKAFTNDFIREYNAAVAAVANTGYSTLERIRLERMLTEPIRPKPR